ncbi:unnamed protein product [Triticum turgidum subsp. durum]|uniref:DUF4283 domain-containing protein n=1 Tax=Triticum turgidum subsp. durum TaxID=4567 RepID=A0A9R1QC96_TRITD|nr:unnamed protein product [Triticum turgidum subsp. durum]
MWRGRARLQGLQAASQSFVGSGASASSGGHGGAAHFPGGIFSKQLTSAAAAATTDGSGAGLAEAWCAAPPPSAPRLQMQMDAAMGPSELCVVRRTLAMNDLERRLQLAMVVYAGGGRRAMSPEFVLEAIQDKVGVLPERMSIHRHRPEDFLVVFARADDRNRVSAMPVMEHRGVRLYFRQWIRQAQATHAAMQFKVKIVMEGIPPHAWEREVAETLLGSACLVDTIDPETSSRSDLSAFRLTAWAA